MSIRGSIPSCPFVFLKDLFVPIRVHSWFCFFRVFRVFRGSIPLAPGHDYDDYLSVCLKNAGGAASWGGRSGEYSPSLPPQVPSIHRTYARAARKPRTWHEWFPMRLLRGVAEPELVAGSLCLPPSPALPQLGETPPVLFVLYACRNGSPSYIKQLFEASRGARPAVSSFNHRRRYHPKQSKPIHNPRV